MEKAVRNRKILLVGILLLFIIVAIFIIMLAKKEEKITETEELKLKEVSNDVMNYIEVIENSESKDIDRYIIYALYYNFNEKDNNTMTTKEIVNNIKDKFTIAISEEEIIELGITPEMLDKNITYDHVEDKFTLNEIKQSYASIAKTEIVKYNLVSMEKKKNEYTLIYDKYIVSNPYEILNYYIDKNNETFEEENAKSYDVSEITAYLQGKEKVGVIKKYIVEDNLSSVADKQGSIKVVYVLKDDKLLIDRIEK